MIRLYLENDSFDIVTFSLDQYFYFHVLIFPPMVFYLVVKKEELFINIDDEIQRFARQRALICVCLTWFRKIV